MKIWRVALNTYRGLLRNRVLLAVLLLFLLILLSSAGMMDEASRLAEEGAAGQTRLLFAREIESLLTTNAFFAFILAALAGAFVLPGEIKSGTILPTLGRALPRSHFLLGLFLGVNLLLASYLGLAALTAGGLVLWSGISPGLHLLVGVLYVVLIANIIAALTFFFSTLVSPPLALVGTIFFVFLSLSGATQVTGLFPQVWSERLRQAVEYFFPAWGLLDFTEYLQLTRAPLARSPSFYLIGIGHALDYLAVFLLLAFLAFRRRSLLPPS